MAFLGRVSVHAVVDSVQTEHYTPPQYSGFAQAELRYFADAEIHRWSRFDLEPRQLSHLYERQADQNFPYYIRQYSCQIRRAQSHTRSLSNDEDTFQQALAAQRQMLLSQYVQILASCAQLPIFDLQARMLRESSPGIRFLKRQ